MSTLANELTNAAGISEGSTTPHMPTARWRWSIVVLFAVAMAWVESAVVYYLRTMINRLEPYQPNPLPIVGGIGTAEVVREAATLVMLLMVGILAGRTWRARWGYAALAFGIWDIFYYVFLKVLTNWPRTLLDWDILFLIPLPWWGPVWAPAAIAALMVVWGTLVTHFEDQPGIRVAGWKSTGLCFLGMLLALTIFMVDAFRVADQGEHALRNMRPSNFHWPWFLVALVLMSAPIIKISCQLNFIRGSFWIAIPAMKRYVNTSNNR